MRKIKLLFTVVLITIPFLYTSVQGFTSLDNCIITSDIGKYIYDSKYSKLGNACGVVGGADHFKLDHIDSICKSEYSNINEIRGLPLAEAEAKILSVDVQVTQHAGADSDKWLLHEVEDSYRSSDNLEATLSKGVQIRTIEGKNIYFMSLYGDKDYTWLSNNVVVDISCNCPNTKPEPLEVVKVYLSKFPSSITLTDTDLKATAHNVQWIKDEMERRLWLCDKWNMQLQLGKVSQTDMLTALVDNMTIFLNYRQKYFGVSATDDITALNISLQANDGTSIKKKLADYKTWWNANKGKSISL